MIPPLGTFLKHYLLTKYNRSFQTRQALEQWQEQQISKFLSRILPQSPFYQELFAGYSIENWREFPTIDKPLMMDEFDRLNTRGIKREEAYNLALKSEETRDFKTKIGDITVGLSSGTSGHRGLFLVSDRERAMWTGTIVAKVLPDPLWKKQHIALFLRANSNLYTSVSGGSLRFRFFDMVQPIEHHLEPLTSFQPTILIAPPSYLRFLAEESTHNRLTIAPRKIISVAEVLDPLDEQAIEAAFQQPIHQIYQCTEGFLGTTCTHGTLHLNEDLIVIQKEYLDGEQRRFSPIITDFSRTTQPILRYRLNDILTERTTPCPCGSSLLAIEQIEGRCDDILPFPSLEERRYIMVFPDFIRRALITASNDIREYLVIQHSPSQLEISLRTFSGSSDRASRAVVQSIRKLCQEQKCHVPDVLFTPYHRHPTTTKLRRVERKFPLPERYQEVHHDI